MSLEKKPVDLRWKPHLPIPRGSKAFEDLAKRCYAFSGWRRASLFVLSAVEPVRVQERREPVAAYHLTVTVTTEPRTATDEECMRILSTFGLDGAWELPGQSTGSRHFVRPLADDLTPFVPAHPQPPGQRRRPPAQVRRGRRAELSEPEEKAN